MIDYDIHILKNNIKTIMQKKNITQTKLADAIGMQQSAISAILNPGTAEKTKKSFTVIQLINIAKYLECSIDELVGEKKENNELTFENLSDILEMLFKIDSNINIDICECKTGNVDTPIESLETPISTAITGLYFKHPAIIKTLNQWNELKLSDIAEPTKSEIIKLWQKSIIQQYSMNMKKWNFRDQLEQGKYLAEIALRQYYEDRTLSPEEQLEINDYENRTILYEYTEKLTSDKEYAKKYYEDFECDFLVRNYGGFTWIPGGIDAELPFEPYS